MNHYDKNPKDLAADAKAFLDSTYGKYIIQTLEEVAASHLSSADDMECPYPERYLAKHSATKEAIELFKQPLDDDQRVGG